MALSLYNKKRKFDVTPEPKGKIERSQDALKFVIQKHQASRLHYDFRLEIDGVMKSWAVPKGPSLNPKDKRLAMMTEDHPMSYRTFEGTIPDGEYGGGDVIVWDEGTYQADGSPSHAESEKMLRAGLKKGELKFTMHGVKVNGSFALVHMHGRQENAWLLIKHKDEFASDVDVTKHAASVRSNRLLGDNAHAKIAMADTPVHYIKPMLASLTDKPFDDPQWIFEIKWDGYRAVGEVTHGGVQLYSRNGQNFARTYPRVVLALQKIKHDVVLDGEVVVVDKSGKSRFQYLQQFGKEPLVGQLQYRVFDLLFCDGVDMRNKPLLERKALLQTVLPKSSTIVYSDHIVGNGRAFFETAVQNSLEGIMAKDGTSSYYEGKRTEAWLKIKSHNRQEVIICGYTEPKGSRKYFGSLILGIYEKDVLKYVGHTGTGFNQQTLKSVYGRVQPFVQKTSPFAEKFKTNGKPTWVKPQLLCEVEFTEWTADGQMRHPSFQGLREADKAMKAVKHETPVQKKSTAQYPSDVPITHIDKIFWPNNGITKGDLLSYYAQMSNAMLPYLKNRLEALNRFPNGITGVNFYQKNITNDVPDFVRTHKLRLETEKRMIRSIICDNEKTLLYLANLGCIEINPWNAVVDSLEYPDWGVIDLDPDTNTFDEVITVAHCVHAILEKFDVPSFPKTSGKTGLHIFIPMGKKYTHDQVKQFIELIVHMVHAQLPDSTSLERIPKKRKGKIYLDYLQNRIGQTLAAPYSVRPWPGATVSTPLTWKEVKQGLHPDQFTIYTVPARIKKIGDIWKPVIGKGINLKAILANIEKTS